MIGWESPNQDGDIGGVFAQRYDQTGNPLGTEFQVNTYTTSGQGNCASAIDAQGNFILTWVSSGQDGDDFGIYAQRFNAAGQPQGGEFRVNTTTAREQDHPGIVLNATGEFVITWQSEDQDGDSDGIYAQRYDKLGQPQ